MRTLATLACLLASVQVLFAQKDLRKELQTQFIMAQPGDTIHLPAGTYVSSGAISMDEKENVVIRGAGMDKTIISFKNQTDGAEGFRIDNSKNITLMDFTLQDAKGDLIKVMNTDGIFMVNVKAEWTGKPKASNGAYALYPVSCSRVVIDGCEAIGASDAGIYVGQSHNIVVKNSKAYHNVAGIEIENSTMADVYNCEAWENTGGILVFDLPDLPKKAGGNVRVFNNNVHHNNYKNFAPKGNVVGFVPPGTGVIVLATSQVEVFDNDILFNQTFSTAIVSYLVTERPINDKEYDPYPKGVYVHGNRYDRERTAPTFKHKMGLLAFKLFRKDVPHIWWDGIPDTRFANEQGQYSGEQRICIRENKTGTFCDLDAANDFKAVSTDVSPYDCAQPALKAAKFTAN